MMHQFSRIDLIEARVSYRRLTHRRRAERRRGEGGPRSRVGRHEAVGIGSEPLYSLGED